ncbi:MAG: type I 3-dehydroquinate dehydratase, partial [Terriglobus sp.]
MPLSTLTPESLHQRAGRICVAVSGPDMFALAGQTIAACSFLEFRLDSVADPTAQLPHLRAFVAANPQVTAVATCRRQPYGGGFTGTAEQQIGILTSAALAGCELIDIETETAEELGLAALETLRAAGAAVILSWHDFRTTPALAPQLERMAPFAPDFRKIVPTATTLTDALQLIDLLQQHGQDGRLIAMSMGFRGTLTRVLGPRFGSLFTFASPEGNAGTAPGQVSLSTLQHLYRAEAITAQTAIYAVAGQPITGSLSPRMHNTAFLTAGLDAVYLPLETDSPTELFAVADRLNIRGLSITMPLKETILPHLTVSDA